ncbi:MAG: hypothetical protein Q9166_005183 [cf. Caloplaca sp. 2 TL-2023]
MFCVVTKSQTSVSRETCAPTEDVRSSVKRVNVYDGLQLDSEDHEQENSEIDE